MLITKKINYPFQVLPVGESVLVRVHKLESIRKTKRRARDTGRYYQMKFKSESIPSGVKVERVK